MKYFNKFYFVNTLMKEREQKPPEDEYPWLDPDDERRHMTDKEILDKYIDLDNSCLSEEEKIEVMDMLYRYREAFRVMDEIGTCLNIKVENDVMDKSPILHKTI